MYNSSICNKRYKVYVKMVVDLESFLWFFVWRSELGIWEGWKCVRFNIRLVRFFLFVFGGWFSLGDIYI